MTSGHEAKTVALPSLDQTLEELARVEARYPDEVRQRETRKALEANERFARDRARVETYLRYLGEKDMFIPIYGLGNTPNGLPVALPRYLIELMDASARVLYALMRKELRERGPQRLIDRMPAGWLSAEMAERLHGYYLTTEPDMAFDVLVFGRKSWRGMSFEEFKASGDILDARLLEAQSVDTYWGWVREFVRGARLAGLTGGCTFTMARDAQGRLHTDESLDREVLDTYRWPLGAETQSVLILEIEPPKQATKQNLWFIADAMCGGDRARRPAILDAADLEIRNGRLYGKVDGVEREIKKVNSRIVDADLQAYIRARKAAGEEHVVERLRQVYQLPHVWPDLSKHLMGFYLIDKSSLTGLSLLGSVRLTPRTELVTPQHVERWRKNPAELKKIAIKPLHGMSAKGVYVGPTLEQVEQTTAQEPMLAQEIIWATPILPNVMPDIQDPDVQAGICSEARLVLQAGTPAVPLEPHRARMVAGLTRNHFQSRDPERKIKNDPRGRGWYSNMGAILAVKGELGIQERDDAGIGMAPIYWLD
ncbi:MAG: hypothetical protein GYA57_04510 [Myxococcales bacterium]|nr:hypothetical protein [Myxococcales bacterium]